MCWLISRLSTQLRQPQGTQDIKQTRNSAKEWQKNTAAVYSVLHKATPDHCMRTGKKIRTAMEQLNIDISMAWY